MSTFNVYQNAEQKLLKHLFNNGVFTSKYRYNIYFPDNKYSPQDGVLICANAPLAHLEVKIRNYPSTQLNPNEYYDGVMLQQSKVNSLRAVYNKGDKVIYINKFTDGVVMFFDITKYVAATGDSAQKNIDLPVNTAMDGDTKATKNSGVIFMQPTEAFKSITL